MEPIDIIRREVDGLVSLAAKLADDASLAERNLGHDRIQELSSLSVRGGQLIRRLYGPESQYSESWAKVLGIKNFTVMQKGYFRHVSELTGILRGVQHEVDAGLLQNLRSLLQAEVFADFLDMAEHLLDEGYKDAAAVILGAVLEDSLRKVTHAAGLPVTLPNGKPLTIDPLNVALAKSGSYNALVQKQVTSWANLRNDAAHGHFQKYDAGQVRQMLFFVQKFAADYLK